MGDGMLMPADVVVPFNEIGRTGPIADLGIYTVNLDTAYIEAVLANGDGWLGVMTYQLTYEGSMAYSVGYGQPQLTIEYVPEPAALAVGLAATLLLRRR